MEFQQSCPHHQRWDLFGFVEYNHYGEAGSLYGHQNLDRGLHHDAFGPEQREPCKQPGHPIGCFRLRLYRGHGYGYDERTTYKGFHLGAGKEFTVKEGNTVEVYGKYFYNRKDGMNFNAGLDEYNLDAVTSQILRVGARYTMKRERWNYYGDLSYEHELDGQAAGRANGMAIRGADTSGGSVRLELGAKLLANEKSPWTLDLNLTGYAGKKQGLQGGVSVKFMF